MEYTGYMVKFDEWISAGFYLYRDNFVVLLLVNLIATVIGVATSGILEGPMAAGVVLVALACLDKRQPPPVIGEVFRGFDYFLDAFLFCLVWGAILASAVLILMFIPCVGPFLAMIAFAVIGTLVVFGMFLIVDRRMSFWPASLASINLVKSNFFPFAGLVIVAAFLGHAGALACGVGALVTMPFAVCILTVAYRDLFGKP